MMRLERVVSLSSLIVHAKPFSILFRSSCHFHIGPQWHIMTMEYFMCIYIYIYLYLYINNSKIHIYIYAYFIYLSIFTAVCRRKATIFLKSRHHWWLVSMIGFGMEPCTTCAQDKVVEADFHAWLENATHEAHDPGYGKFLQGLVPDAGPLPAPGCSGAVPLWMLSNARGNRSGWRAAAKATIKEKVSLLLQDLLD